MHWYCEKCKKIHAENVMCPRIRTQLKDNPQLLTGAADFTVVAGEYSLITSNALDTVAQGINKVAGTNLSYEGTHQFARDIQVFRRMNLERYPIKGYFSSPESAKEFIENASPAQLKNLYTNFNGMGQEIDYVRNNAGNIKSVFTKTELYNNNMAGVDGHTVWRFNGKEISRTTVKAASTKGGLNRNVQDIMDAIEKGTLKPDDKVYGIKGTKEALEKKLQKRIEYELRQGNTKTAELMKQAKEGLKVQEHGTTESVKESTRRLAEKTAKGQATTAATMEQIGQKAVQGSIVGAAVGLTISGITNYVRYQNGEITREEAFRDVSEDTLKGALIGGAMGAITIFLPGGAIGLAGGMMIGMYLDKVCTNILDEIYGKGAYGAILDSSGYVYGMTVNLETCLKKIEANMRKTQDHIEKTQTGQQKTRNTLKILDQMKEAY